MLEDFLAFERDQSVRGSLRRELEKNNWSYVSPNIRIHMSVSSTFIHKTHVNRFLSLIEHILVSTMWRQSVATLKLMWCMCTDMASRTHAQQLTVPMLLGVIRNNIAQYWTIHIGMRWHCIIQNRASQSAPHGAYRPISQGIESH